MERSNKADTRVRVCGFRAREMIHDEVKRANERLRLMKEIIEEVLIKSLPDVELTKEEIKEIESSIKEMKKGDYVTIEELKRA